MRVLFVQFGDYKEAYERLKKTGEETYYAQKYTVQWVEDLAQKIEYVGVLCLDHEEYHEILPNQVHALGFKYFLENQDQLCDLIAAQNPTHLITCTPYHPILKWAIKTQTTTLPLLADSFEETGLRSWYHHFRLKRLLNHFDFVANHNINASLSLKRIGVQASKILPWDFPPLLQPDSFKPKKFPESPRKNLLYVGSMTEKKGVSETLLALAHLKEKGLDYHLTLLGGGELEYFHNKIEDLHLQNETTLVGRVSHERIIDEMVKCDALLIPSRHEYPEGLPLTIYEGLCTHTPLILSDHPMFLNKIVHEENGLLFKASQPLDLADKIEKLFNHPALYEALSNNSQAAWLKLQIPLKWDQLLEKWLSHSTDDLEWLLQHNLESTTKKLSSTVI